MNLFNRSNYIAEIYGTLVAGGLIIYFLLMRMVGLAHITELRVVNLLILLAGIYYGLKQYRQTHRDQLNYFRALGIGMATSIIAVSTFTLFIFFYLKLNTEFMQIVKENGALGEYLDPYIASFGIWAEGVLSGMTATFILTNSIRTEHPTNM